jgi:CubicO group peptidase (beta-lactamase class C family)
VTAIATHGDVDAGFGTVADAFAANFEERGDVGAACAVYLDGEPVVDLWGGFADRDAARAWERDTLTLTFSTTKGVTAVCCNRLIEEGRLDPDAAVAQYWPEFAANGKEHIPVKWVLSHRAGLAHCDGTFTLDEVMATTPVVEALAEQAPNWEPGSAHGYHTRTYGWLLGEIVRRITGMSLGTYFATEFAAPLGLDYYIGLPEQLEPRVARLYPPEAGEAMQALIDAAVAGDSLMGAVMSGPSGLFRYDDMWNTRPLHATEMPSSNGIGDARSLARLYASCIGTVTTADGQRFRALSDDTVARATTVLSEGPDMVIGLHSAFGLGFTGPAMLPPDVGASAFGHAGAGGSLGFADPEAGVGFGYVMNQMQLGLEEDLRAPALVRALYSALG